MKTDKTPPNENEANTEKTKNAKVKSDSDKGVDHASQYEIKNDGQAGLTGEAVDKQDPANNVG